MDNLKLLNRKALNSVAWDNCINEDETGLIYAFSWYLDIVCTNWDAIVIENHQKYELVFPIPWRKKLGVKYIYTPAFIQQLGFFGSIDVSKELFDKLLRVLKDNYHYANVFIKNELQVTKSSIFHQRTNLLLPLNASYDEIFNDFSKNHKRNIKKISKDLYVQEGSNLDPIIKLFKNSAIAKSANFTKNDYQLFNKLSKLVGQKASFDILLVFDKNGVIICGGVFFIHKKRITFIFSGNSKDSKNKKGMFLLFTYLIKKYSQKGYVMDFEGSENEGLKRFYEGFGAQIELYFHMHFNNLPKWLKWIKP